MGLHVIDLRFAHARHAAADGPVLDSVDVRFPSRQISLITGANGAGKTTFLHLLACLLRPDRGEIRAEGEPVSRWSGPHRDRWRRRVGIVFQHFRLIDDLTVLENVMLPGIPMNSDIRMLRRAGMDALERLGIVDLASRRTFELSGGERQKAAVARAVASTPRYLIADEPFSHQDFDGRERMVGILRSLAAGGATVVVASHEEVMNWADRAFRLDSGRLESIR